MSAVVSTLDPTLLVCPFSASVNVPDDRALRCQKPNKFSMTQGYCKPFTAEYVGY